MPPISPDRQSIRRGSSQGPAIRAWASRGSCHQAGFEPGRSGLGTARTVPNRGGLARNGPCANRRAGKGPILAGNRTYAHFGPRAPVRPPPPSPLGVCRAPRCAPFRLKNGAQFGREVGEGPPHARLAAAPSPIRPRPKAVRPPRSAHMVRSSPIRPRNREPDWHIVDFHPGSGTCSVSGHLRRSPSPRSTRAGATFPTYDLRDPDFARFWADSPANDLGRGTPSDAM